MKYLFGILVASYALLSVAAASIQVRNSKRKDTSVLMICGGLLLTTAVFLMLLHWNFDWLFAVTGGACICLAAFLNGKRNEAFHLNHHIIRFIVTLLIVVGFIRM